MQRRRPKSKQASSRDWSGAAEDAAAAGSTGSAQGSRAGRQAGRPGQGRLGGGQQGRGCVVGQTVSVSRAAGGASRQNGRSQACGAVVGGLAAGEVGLFGAGAGAGLALTLGWARRVSACEAHDVRCGWAQREETEHRRRCHNRTHPSSPTLTPPAQAAPPRLWTLDLSRRLPHRTSQPAPAARTIAHTPPHAGAAAARFVPRELESHSSWPASANSNRPVQPPACLYLSVCPRSARPSPRPSPRACASAAHSTLERRRQHARRQRVLSTKHHDREPTPALPSISAWTPALCYPRSVPFVRPRLTAPAPPPPPAQLARDWKPSAPVQLGLPPSSAHRLS